MLSYTLLIVVPRMERPSSARRSSQTAVGEALLALFLRYAIGEVVVPEFQQLPKLAFRQAVC